MATSSSAKPFLRWAGGKNWLVKYLPAIIGDLQFNRYVEPFVGGGSIFFALNPDNALLSDANEELINTYIGVRDEIDQVLDILASWEVTEEKYYEIRSLRPETSAERSARFIYLNRTSFNGIYRVNKKGEYNVPYGRADNYKFDFQRIRNASSALQGTTLRHGDFSEALAGVREGDLVFLDPPYTVSHNQNGFIEYNKKLFSLEDQHQLKKCIDEVKSRDAYFILTNAAHKTVVDIFKDTGEMYELRRHCGLGGKNAKRQSVGECIFTNIPGVMLEGLDE